VAHFIERRFKKKWKNGCAFKIFSGIDKKAASKNTKPAEAGFGGIQELSFLHVLRNMNCFLLLFVVLLYALLQGWLRYSLHLVAPFRLT
jgi:hypothetical protein